METGTSPYVMQPGASPVLPMPDYKPLFPYFGGKSRIAEAVWAALGNPRVYVEPFFGSGAVLFMRPHSPGAETVNDIDGMICNFWRAVQVAPDAVARHADWPVNETDLHARHRWLIGEKPGLVERLENDPAFYDAKIAGWWCWGLCAWIGTGWGKSGARQIPQIGNPGRGVHRPGQDIAALVRGYAARLRHVRVCCGDWSRLRNHASSPRQGLTGVFLDPPYSAEAGRDNAIYTEESKTVAHDARRWAIEHGDNPQMRIALCGYEGEHEFPPGWRAVAWKAGGGYGSYGDGQANENSRRERIWLSPHCLGGYQQADIFDKDGT